MAGDEIIKVDVVFNTAQADEQLARIGEITKNIGNLDFKSNLGDMESQVRRIRDILSQPINLEVRLAGLDNITSGVGNVTGIAQAFEEATAAARKLGEVRLELSTTALVESLEKVQSALLNVGVAVQLVNDLRIQVDVAPLVASANEARSAFTEMIGEARRVNDVRLELEVGPIAAAALNARVALTETADSIGLVNATRLDINTAPLIEALRLAQQALSETTVAAERVNSIRLELDTSQVTTSAAAASNAFTEIASAAQRVNEVQLRPDIGPFLAAAASVQTALDAIAADTARIGAQPIGIDLSALIGNAYAARDALLESFAAAERLSQVQFTGESLASIVTVATELTSQFDLAAGHGAVVAASVEGALAPMRELVSTAEQVATSFAALTQVSLFDPGQLQVQRESANALATALHQVNTELENIDDNQGLRGTVDRVLELGLYTKNAVTSTRQITEATQKLESVNLAPIVAAVRELSELKVSNGSLKELLGNADSTGAGGLQTAVEALRSLGSIDLSTFVNNLGLINSSAASAATQLDLTAQAAATLAGIDLSGAREPLQAISAEAKVAADSFAIVRDVANQIGFVPAADSARQFAAAATEAVSPIISVEQATTRLREVIAETSGAQLFGSASTNAEQLITQIVGVGNALQIPVEVANRLAESIRRGGIDADVVAKSISAIQGDSANRAAEGISSLTKSELDAAAAADKATRSVLALPGAIELATEQARNLQTALTEVGLTASITQAKLTSPTGVAQFKGQIVEVQDELGKLATSNFTLNSDGTIRNLTTKLTEFDADAANASKRAEELGVGIGGAADRATILSDRIRVINDELAQSGVQAEKVIAVLNQAGDIKGFSAVSKVEDPTAGVLNTTNFKFDSNAILTEVRQTQTALKEVSADAEKAALSSADIGKAIAESTGPAEAARQKIAEIKQELSNAGIEAQKVRGQFDELGQLKGFTAQVTGNAVGGIAPVTNLNYDDKGSLQKITSGLKEATASSSRFSEVANQGLQVVTQGMGGAAATASFMAQGFSQIGVSAGVLSGALVGIAAASFAFEQISSFSASLDTLTASLGSTHEEAAQLEPILKEVFANTTVDIKDATAALASFERQFGDAFTTADIEKLTGRATALNEKLPGGGNAALQEQTKLMNQYGLSVDQAAQFQDVLAYSTQEFGGDLGRLTTDLRAAAPVLSSLGFDPNEQAVLAGQFEAVGINLSEVTLGLNKFANEARSAGVDAREDLVRVFEQISNTSNDAAGDAEAASIAIDVFGTRANQALKIAQGIKGGDISLTTLQDSVAEANGRLEQTEDVAHSLQDVFNNVKASITAAFGQPEVINALEDAIKNLEPTILTMATTVAALAEAVSKAADLVGPLANLAGSTPGLKGKNTAEKTEDFVGDVADKAGSGGFFSGGVQQAFATFFAKKLLGDDHFDKDGDYQKPSTAKDTAGGLTGGSIRATLGDSDDNQVAAIDAVNKATAEAGDLVDRRRKAEIELTTAVDKGSLSDIDRARIADDTGLSQVQVAETYDDLNKKLKLGTLSTDEFNVASNSLLGALSDGTISFAEYGDAATTVNSGFDGAKISVDDVTQAGKDLISALQPLGGALSEGGLRAVALANAMDSAVPAADRLAAAIKRVTNEQEIQKKLGTTFVPTLTTAVNSIVADETDDTTADKASNKAAKNGIDSALKAARAQKKDFDDAIQDQIDAITKLSDAQKKALDQQIDAIDKQIDALEKLKKGTGNLTADQRSAHQDRLTDLQAEQAALGAETTNLAANIELVEAHAISARTYANNNPTFVDAQEAARQAEAEAAGLRALQAARVPNINDRKGELVGLIQDETTALRDQADAVRELSAEEQRAAIAKRRDFTYQLSNDELEINNLRNARDLRRAELTAQRDAALANPGKVGNAAIAETAQRSLDQVDAEYTANLADVQKRRGQAQQGFDDEQSKIDGDSKARLIRGQEEILKARKDALNDQKKSITDSTKDQTDALKDQKDAQDKAYEKIIDGLGDQKDAIEAATAAVGDGATKGAKKAAVTFSQALNELTTTFAERNSVINDLLNNSTGIGHALELIFDPTSGLSDDQKFAFAKELRDADTATRAELDRQAATTLSLSAKGKDKTTELSHFLGGANEAQEIEDNYRKGFDALALAGGGGVLANAILSGFTANGGVQISKAARGSGEKSGVEFSTAMGDAAAAGLDVDKLLDGANKAVNEAGGVGERSGSNWASNYIEKSIINPLRLLTGPTAAAGQAGSIGGSAGTNFRQSMENSAGSGSFSGLLKGASDTAGSITRTIIGAAASLSPSLRNEGDLAGQYLDLGIHEGINRGLGNFLSSSVKNLGGSILNILRTSLGVHSPSTETEEMAGFFVDGFVVGLDNHGERMLEAASRAIDPVKQLTANGGAFTSDVTSNLEVSSSVKQTVKLAQEDIDRIVAALKAGPDEKPTFASRRPVGVN